MSGTVIAAIISFVVLFTVWVVLPSLLKKRRQTQEQENSDE